MPIYCQLETKEHDSIEFYKKIGRFYQKNEFENAVCKTDGHFIQGSMC